MARLWHVWRGSNAFGIKVLFVSFPEVRQHTEGLGEFLPRPISTDELLETVGRMLDRHD